MRTTALLLLLGALLAPTPAAHATVPVRGGEGAAHSVVAQAVVVQAAATGTSTGGRSRGGYRSTTVGGTGSSGGSGGHTPAWMWPLVIGGGILVTLIVIADRRKRKAGD